MNKLKNEQVIKQSSASDSVNNILFTIDDIKQALFDLSDVLFNNCQKGISEDDCQNYTNMILESIKENKLSIKQKEFLEIQESNNNGLNWFNAYQDVDSFLFDKLFENGLDFITKYNEPQLNTIESIKLLSNLKPKKTYPKL